MTQEKISCTFVLALCDYRKHLLADYHTHSGGDPSWDVQFQIGSKYVRCFTVRQSTVRQSVGAYSRSCHSFISRADGSIWKSASWKLPAKNFPRGSVYDSTTWSKIHWQGF